MDKRSLSERDICTKFITPALRQAGWDEMLQIREEVSVKRRPKLTLDRRPKLTHRFRGADGSVRPGGAGWGCAAGASAVR